MKKVTVQAPATTANIGPGFDCFGCALTMANTITVAPSSHTVITGCSEEFANENNLAYRAAKAVYDRCGISFPALNIDIKTVIPLARGLGSSASMLAGGAVAANALCGNVLSKNELLEILTEIEGHPDNLAPALFGGFTSAMMSGNKIFVEKYSVHPSLCFCVLIPDFEVSTHEARKVLPHEIPFGDTCRQIARAVMLLRGIEKGDKELISASIHDVLHEPYRSKLIAGFDEVKKTALDLGATAFFISGSGPSCIALTDDPSFDEKLKRALSGYKNLHIKMLGPDTQGTVITEEI